MMHVDSNTVCWNYMVDHYNIQLVVPENRFINGPLRTDEVRPWFGVLTYWWFVF